MEPAVLEYGSPSTARRRHFQVVQELGLVGVIAVMFVVLSIVGYIRARPGDPNLFLNPSFLIDNVATPMSIYAIMAVGMTMVIISGGIDISVGSAMALSSLGAAATLQFIPKTAPAWEVLPVALLIGPVIGMACGLINGSLVVGLGVHPFIITLGTLSIFRCLTIVAPKWAHTQATLPTADRYLPLAFSDHFMRLKVFGERPMPMALMVAIAAVGWFYLSQTIGGREIYAVGGNEEAARFSGLRTSWVKLRVYVIAGLAAGIAGTVNLGRFGSTSTSTGSGYELDVVAAAVVGGASLLGGRGTALGAVLGTLVIATIQAGIYIMNWPEEYRLGIVGSAIILAVAVDRFSETLRLRGLGARAT